MVGTEAIGFNYAQVESQISGHRHFDVHSAYQEMT
jgi:hypothetical protein